ncbi:MAG: hypothetical protein KKC85_14990, partial [Gammaproteobacteria bacterium]|nr:hypothetical protein [Gammaproteobacteria bacterium]
KPATQRSIVFHVMFDGASKDMGAAVKLKTESAAKKLGLVAQQFPGNLPQGAHSCFLEWEAGKLQIKPDGKDLGPAYRAKMITLDESGFAQVKQMERSSAEWVLYKDYISVKDIPVIVEIQDSCVFAIDLTKKKCLIRLQEKTLLFAAYCSHLSRGVFFQIKTEEFKKYILNAKLTEGHFMMLNAMSNFPRDDKAPAVKMFIFCREKKTGHANDATACMEYVRNFSKCYSEFAAGATDIFMKREGTKYQLHRMEEHVNVHFYSEKDISKYYLFEASGNKLEFTLTSISDQEKGELVVVKKGAALSKHAYKELGIKAFDNYKSASFVADRKSGKRS